MSLDPDLLPERLNALADQVGPSGRIDADRAVADARRTLARRRRTRGGAALSTIAVVGALIAFFAVGAQPQGGGAAAPTASPTASASFPRTAHDPVAVGLSFGWLPPGLYSHSPSWPSVANVLMSYLMVEADATPEGAKSTISESRLDLYTAPPGSMPHQSMQWVGFQESDVAGPLIGGNPSWIETPSTGYYGPNGLGAVVWKLPDGDWAVLSFTDGARHGQGSGIFDRANVIRIARSVTQTPVPVALPLHITGALAQAEVTAIQSSSTNGTNLFQPSYWLALTFREAGAEIDVTLRGGPEGMPTALPGQACTPATLQPTLVVMACVA
ncbi:hypothetical protein KDL01_34855, partial [Actinospica durhamensis]